jgi:hypothetical protein
MVRSGQSRLAVGLALCVAAGSITALSVSASAAGSASLTFLQHPRSITPNVAIANLDGSDVRTLGPGTSALISPDGSAVAVVEDLPGNAGSRLSVYPTSGGAARQIYRSAAFINLIGWSADSELLLADAPTGLKQTGPLLTINAASGATQTVANGVFAGASFSEAGTDDVVYAMSNSQQLKAAVNLYTSLPSGGDTKELTSDGHSMDPLWGPDGIVFARFRLRGKDAYPVNQLWSINADGSDAKQLTHMSVSPLVEGLSPVAFSANGKHLLAVFGGEDTSAAWTVDLSGPTAVVHDLGNAYENTPEGISRDGKTVLLSTGFEGTPAAVEIVPWHGGKPTVVIKGGGQASWND